MSVRRIVGCPGGGKSTKVTQLAARAASKYGRANVMAVSLTKAAAAELAGRTDTTLDNDTCATMHAHALRALDYDSAKLAETRDAMRAFHNAHPHLTPNQRRDDPEDAPAPTGGLHAQVINHRARMTPLSQWTPEQRDYHAAWTDHKTQTDREDFTDLIERCLAEHVAPLGRPRVILADEAQDFTKLEFTLLTQWAKDTDSTVLVGDAAQCCYYFRGADPESLQQVPVAHGETLSQSHRCPRAVATAAQRWAAQLPGPPVTWTPRDADGQVTQSPFALRDAADVADHVQGLDGTTMVLATCRYMLAPLLAELRARGIPYANPWSDEPAWNPLSGPGSRALLALLAPTLDDGHMWTWGDLHAITDPMAAGVLGRGVKASIKEHCRNEQGERRDRDTVPLATLQTLLGETVCDRLLAIDRDPAAAIDWWQTGLLARHAKPISYAARVWRTGGAKALTQVPRLCVGTAHSTKGGEADHVLVSPEISKNAYYGPDGWHGGGPGRDAIVRLGYVALTRARETLTLLEPGCPEHMPLDEIAGVAA